MKNNIIIAIGLALAVFACHATDTNTYRIWFNGPHSGSILLDTNASVPTPREIAETDLPNLILSRETNFLKSGFFVGGVPHKRSIKPFILIRNGNVVNEVCLAMLNTSTNKIDYWTPWPKRVESQFELTMEDSHGNAVHKTLFGKKFGQSPPRFPDDVREIDAQRYGLHRAGVQPQGDCLYSFQNFNPKNDIPRCFELKESGNYKLTFIHHIYMAEHCTNGFFLKPITFPPVVVDVCVEISP